MLFNSAIYLLFIGAIVSFMSIGELWVFGLFACMWVVGEYCSLRWGRLEYGELAS